MAAEGLCLDKEFGDFLEGLRVSLNFNHFSYKKVVNNNINFLRVVLFTIQIFKEKRIVVNVNDSRVDRYLKNANVMLSQTKINEKDNDLDDDEQKKDEHKSFDSNPSQSSKSSERHKEAKGGKDEPKKRKDGDKNRDAGRLRERDERHAREKAGMEANKMKYDKEI
ncbi:hypothetical protein AgCh_027464 [Apium graveolens]